MTGSSPRLRLGTRPAEAGMGGRVDDLGKGGRKRSRERSVAGRILVFRLDVALQCDLH